MGTTAQPSGSALARAVADAIRRAQSAASLSNRQLAELIGVTHPYLGQRFSYQKDFTLTDVEKLCKALGVSPLQIFQEAVKDAAKIQQAEASERVRGVAEVSAGEGKDGVVSFPSRSIPDGSDLEALDPFA